MTTTSGYVSYHFETPLDEESQCFRNGERLVMILPLDAGQASLREALVPLVYMNATSRPHAINTLRFEPYTGALAEEVEEFNQRIAPADPAFFLLGSPAAYQFPKSGSKKIYQETFVALENGRVRGGYTLKQQEFSFHGDLRMAAACQMPISEGLVDRNYAFVGARMLRDAVRRQPLLFGLGIGSADASIARVERAMGWTVRIIPFYFRVINGFAFLRNIEYLKRTRRRRLLLDACAYAGLGWVGARLAESVLARPVEQRLLAATEFGDWADRIWEACEYTYSMTAVRTSDVLNLLYPPGDRCIRLKVLERGHTIGWAVLMDTKMSNNKYFGNMRVGSIVDCLAVPDDAQKVISVASEVLKRRGVDLLVSNQSHPAWCEAMQSAGFIQGSSNFIFTASQGLSKILEEIDPAETGIHINRGDGDGPIHL
jgi:hypothetical protein